MTYRPRHRARSYALLLSATARIIANRRMALRACGVDEPAWKQIARSERLSDQKGSTYE